MTKIVTVIAIAHSAVGQIASPPLEVAHTNNTIVLSWPAAATDFRLQATGDPASVNAWSNVTTTTELVGDRKRVIHPGAVGFEFFRLKGPQITYPSHIFQFAVFHEGTSPSRPLEFTFSGPLTIHGRVHANGPIFLGSPSPLTFKGPVTAVSTISKPAWAGHSPSQYTGSVLYQGIPNYLTNLPVFSLPLGTNITPAAYHASIDIPPAAESPNSPSGQGRFFHRAKIVLLISNETTTAYVRSAWSLLPGADQNAAILMSANTIELLDSTFPFLSLTNTFLDQRENKTVLATQIDLARFGVWSATNTVVQSKLPGFSSAWPNVLYIADLRSSSSTQLCAVRLSNGTVLPVHGGTGLTVATPNPLYIWGNFNCPNAAHLGSTNTSATVPSALIADALTILSSSWDDALSASKYTERVAASTTVNAGILAGLVYSTGAGTSQYSGGIPNLPRLLEDWNEQTLWINGSIVSLFNSSQATNQYQGPGIYYSEPSREISFDRNFNNPKRQPAGTWTTAVVSLP